MSRWKVKTSPAVTWENDVPGAFRLQISSMHKAKSSTYKIPYNPGWCMHRILLADVVYRNMNWTKCKAVTSHQQVTIPRGSIQDSKTCQMASPCLGVVPHICWLGSSTWCSTKLHHSKAAPNSETPNTCCLSSFIYIESKKASMLNKRTWNCKLSPATSATVGQEQLLQRSPHHGLRKSQKYLQTS